MDFILSLKHGQPIAEIYNAKTEQGINKIFIRESPNGESEIECHMPEQLLDDEFFKNNGVYPSEKDKLKEAVKTGNKQLLANGYGGKRREEALLNAYEAAWVYISEKVKRNIILPPGDVKIRFVAPDGWMGHMFVSGPTGAGKSYFINDFIMRMRPPPKAVHVFTPLADGDYKQLPNVNAYKIDQSVVENPFTLEEFAVLKDKDKKDPRPDDYQRVIMIFDDIESIGRKDVRESMQQFRDMVLQAGRHYNLVGIVVYHDPMLGFATKKIINECTYFVMFPKSAPQVVSRFLESKFGCPKNVRERILNLPTRSVVVKKNLPYAFVYQYGVFLY